MDLIPGLRRSPGTGHGNPFQYSCLENPMDRGAWWITIHGVTKSQIRLKRLITHTHAREQVVKLTRGTFLELIFLYYRFWTLSILLYIAKMVSKVIVLTYISTSREGEISQILTEVNTVAVLFLINYKI